MAVYDNIVEGQTEAIVHTLLADGVAVNGTGITLGLVLMDKVGGVVDTSGSKVSWLDASTGKAQFLPAVGDLTAIRSPYNARWTLTAAGKTGFYPNRQVDTWIVQPQ